MIFVDVEANVTFEDRTRVVTCIRSLPQNAINAAAKTRSSTATCRIRRAPLHQRQILFVVTNLHRTLARYGPHAQVALVCALVRVPFRVPPPAA